MLGPGRGRGTLRVALPSGPGGCQWPDPGRPPGGGSADDAGVLTGVSAGRRAPGRLRMLGPGWGRGTRWVRGLSGPGGCRWPDPGRPPGGGSADDAGVLTGVSARAPGAGPVADARSRAGPRYAARGAAVRPGWVPVA